MKKQFFQISINLMLGMLLVSCNTGQNANAGTSTPTTSRTPTRVATFISTSTLTATPKPAFTPLPTTVEQVTLEAFGPLCIGAKEVSRAEISPNGEWIAALCYWENENETEQSPLQVISMDRSKEWKIYYRDYAKSDMQGDRHDGMMPYRWSQDGRYLYAIAGSRLSGCCWKGHRFMLLVRLNLETGEQIDILNATDLGTSFPFDFIISDSDRYLLFIPPSHQSYDFAIMDLLTWRTQTVTLKFPETLDLYYAVMSPEEDRIVVPLYKFYKEESDFKFDSIVMINIKTNEQKILVSNWKSDEELYPIRWINTEQVLLSTTTPIFSYYQKSAEYWILNVNTGELVRTEKP